MSDCVDREVVINAINRILNPCTDMAECITLSHLKEDIERLPAVEPERPTGHWIIHSEHCKSLGVQPSGLGEYYWCSQCNCGIDSKAFHMIEYNFCPHCGAKMENNA